MLNPPVEFQPNCDQQVEFDFDLLRPCDEPIKYSPSSLQAYFNQHFFMCKGYIYQRAGDGVESQHPFFKKPQTMKKTLKWFEDCENSWGEYCNVSIPTQSSLTRELKFNIPDGITEYHNIQPILDFDKDMCGGDEKQMMLFHQYLGMKLKYPSDIKKLSDKFIVFSGPQGNGKTSIITNKLHLVFGHEPYQAHMKDYGNKQIYNHANRLNIIIDDAFSAKTTDAQESTVKEMTSKTVVGGNIRNRSSTWFFVNDSSLHNTPMKNGRRCQLFRTGVKYNRKWDLLKVVDETTTKYRDEYVAYLLSTVQDMENLNDVFTIYETEQIKDSTHDVLMDPTDSAHAKVRNYFKHDMLENPQKYTNFPFKLPKAKQVVADVQELYGTNIKVGLVSAYTGVIQAVIPRLEKNNKQGVYVIRNKDQLQSIAACCCIYGDSFEQVFFTEPTSDDSEYEEQDDEPDEPITIVMTSEQTEIAMLKAQMQEMQQMGMQLFAHQQAQLFAQQQAQQVHTPIIIPIPRPLALPLPLPLPETPTPTPTPTPKPTPKPTPTPCKCGLTTHKRTNNKLCPLNKK
jgi:hypothetical protein